MQPTFFSIVKENAFQDHIQLAIPERWSTMSPWRLCLDHGHPEATASSTGRCNTF